MKNLQLSLETKWFEMTKAGIKTEDYRNITEYWMKRLLTKESYNLYLESKYSGGNEFENGNFDIMYAEFKPFTKNTMTLGYPKKDDVDKIRVYEHHGIEIREGNPEWGATPGRIYFVIKHGKSINK